MNNRFNLPKKVRETFESVDKDVTRKLILCQITKEEFIALLGEVGISHGYNLIRGDKVLINPDLVPSHIKFGPEDCVILNKAVDVQTINFIPASRV